MAITVHYEAEAVDERTGEPFRWRNGFDSPQAARAHLRKIARGQMRDPGGAPWPNVRAWIESDAHERE